MKKKLHTILNERYRPTTLENFICKDEIKEKFQEFIDKQDIPHLGLFGPPGSGKTTLAKILSTNIDCDFIYLNAADERSIDTIREKVIGFASSGTFKPWKIVILDESTHLLQASQVILLNTIETYSLKTRFILTGNYPERLIEPLRSRLQEFGLQPPSKKTVAQHLHKILLAEEITHEVEDIALLINKFYPDLRKILNVTQQYTTNNILKLDKTINNSVDYLDEILTLIKEPKMNTFNAVRQIIADNGITNFDEAYRFLYNNLDKYSKGKDGSITVKIEEYKYHSVSRIDQEICFMALINSILDIILKKQMI